MLALCLHLGPICTVKEKGRPWWGGKFQPIPGDDTRVCAAPIAVCFSSVGEIELLTLPTLLFLCLCLLSTSPLSILTARTENDFTNLTGFFFCFLANYSSLLCYLKTHLQKVFQQEWKYKNCLLILVLTNEIVPQKKKKKITKKFFYKMSCHSSSSPVKDPIKTTEKPTI